MTSLNESYDMTLPVGGLVDMKIASNVSSFHGIVTEGIKQIFMVMNFAILCQIITILGSIANIINIIVFVKLGFKDPVNITLLSLACSDFGACFSLILLTICYNPAFQKLDNLPFDPLDFHYLTSGWVHNAFTRITSCITAFITVERCLCVAAPLKVKSIITPTRVSVILVSIVLLVIACVSPIYYAARHEWRFHPDKNKSLISLIFIENTEELNQIAYTINSIFLPIGSFIVVLVSTVILVYNLRKKSKWRKNVTSTSDSLSSRDAKVSKMVVMVATLFIVCFVPVFISVTFMVGVPEFNIQGRYENVFLIMFSYHFALESLNSSLNIFIYYRMSSNYRAVFNKLFRREQTQKQQESKVTT